MKRLSSMILALTLTLSLVMAPARAADLNAAPATPYSPLIADADFAAETLENIEGFRYKHDPRLNPKAMADIVVDHTAVYGFAPSVNGSLSSYVAFDWSDPDLVNGENGRLARIAYHESINEMYAMMNAMKIEGKSVEEIARAVSSKRNEIRLAAYADNPEGLAAAKERNLEKYGHEGGPLPDDLYAQYGSWEIVLEKAFSANPGMDACLGLYDDYYELYIMAGQIEEENTAVASREYAVAALIDAAGIAQMDGPEQLSAFSDADAVSAYYSSELSAAVEAGILRGFDDRTLRPQSAVTYIEALVLLSRCLPNLEETGDAIVFADVPAWAKDDIDRLTKAGLLSGVDGDALGAAEPITVEQVSNLAQRLIPEGTK